MQPNTTTFPGKEKYKGIRLENIPDPNSASALRDGPDASALQKLLTAAKDAEVLIACIFELHLFTADPLLEIWTRLAAAIKEAQSTLQAEHIDGLSAQSEKETLNGDLSTNHVRVLCGVAAGSHRHRRMVLQEKKGE